MDFKEETIAVLVRKLIASRSPQEQFEIAMELSLRSPESGKDLQLLNRAINYFKNKHPEVYDRAKDTIMRVVRSIPPCRARDKIDYLRSEEACAKLVNTQKQWKEILKERKSCLGRPERRFFSGALRGTSPAGKNNRVQGFWGIPHFRRSSGKPRF